MSILIADESLQAKLAAARGEGSIKICTPDGTVIGFFISADPSSKLEPAVSEEELRRREADTSGRWYSAAEVEQRLKDWRCSR